MSLAVWFTMRYFNGAPVRYLDVPEWDLSAMQQCTYITNRIQYLQIDLIILMNPKPSSSYPPRLRIHAKGSR